MNRRHFLLAAVVAACTAMAAACLSPTLPLPPPEAPDNIAQTSDGVWEIRGECTAGARVLIKNEHTGAIVGFDDEQFQGRYKVELPAERCDAATLSEVVYDEATVATWFIVREVVGGVPQAECSTSGE